MNSQITGNSIIHSTRLDEVKKNMEEFEQFFPLYF